ncbi:hypothetical protein G6321_00001120 (plasmid) [Bradyrhizobium barranii subsp. barranii]|uniref:Uncharacterized protein n=1 Tax=Bradyrhizobium barranii subsp. barranii TaxID=2823807 RepID=A0A7Z0QNR9_9BRAD|nr:hypothetical protein [Bradyrhizobium barranii]UGX89721.1 hypothetical protein G6321_00001120 [Bradyrhizobium barranii subsp. barranii]
MREELPKGQTLSSSPRQIVKQYAALGVRVDTNGHSDSPGVLSGEAMIRLMILTGMKLGAHFRAACCSSAAAGIILGRMAAPGLGGAIGNGSLPAPSPARHKRAPEILQQQSCKTGLTQLTG